MTLLLNFAGDQATFWQCLGVLKCATQKFFLWCCNYNYCTPVNKPWHCRTLVPGRSMMWVTYQERFRLIQRVSSHWRIWASKATVQVRGTLQTDSTGERYFADQECKNKHLFLSITHTCTHSLLIILLWSNVAIIIKVPEPEASRAHTF